MSRIPAKVSELRRSARRLRRSAEALEAEPSLLLLFYSVECALKERYYVAQRGARPNDDASAIDEASFGRSGHDLGKGCKAVRAPASLAGSAPPLVVRGRVWPLEHAHQVWRYGIDHTGSDEAERWLRAVDRWLRDNR